MAYDRFLIAPFNSGLQTDLKPFLIPDDAYAQLSNAYVFRGRVRKRFGSRLMNTSVASSVSQLYSRVRINLGNTLAVSGNFTNLGAAVPGIIWEKGQMFSIGNTIFTVWQTNGAMLSTGIATGTFNTTNGMINITGNTENPLTPVYFYPAQPIMGLISYESSNINDEPVYAFDTQFAYFFNGTGWERLGTAVWTGTDAQFFWGSTWRGTNSYDYLLFITNFNVADQIKYWNGAAWTTINPAINVGGDTLETARILLPFKNRLIALNTIEKISTVNQSFVNRCRFSQNGSPIAADAWREDIAGKGNYIDAPTREAIITAQFLKDRLIVYFESSTWELVYTGNEILPFIWQQINTEFGAESTFSEVPFDKVILGVGNVGIMACNGSNVERIDEKIPDSVFGVSNNNDGVFRVYGIRDYYVEMLYWTFPSDQEANPFAVYPNRVLVYNYKTGSWAFNDDTITCFGYYQDSNDLTWSSASQTWGEAIETWGSPTIQARFRNIVAGNQEGFVFIIDTLNARNAPALQITNMTTSGTLTIYNHNLSSGDFILIENSQGITTYNNNIYQVRVIDIDNISIDTVSTGTYLGGGTVARVSRIDILTKQYNFYLSEARNMSLDKIDFYVDKTQSGQIAVDCYPSSSGIATTSSVLQTSPFDLYPLEQVQDRFWHPIYPNVQGQVVQVRIYFNNAQMLINNIVLSDFEMNAIVYYVQKTSNRLE